MSGNVFWVLLILAVCSEANATNGELDQKKKEAQEKIKETSLSSENQITGVVRETHEAINYFHHSVETYIKEEDRIKANITAEIRSLSRQYIGLATDKNEKVNSFKCVLKVKADTEKAFQNIYINSIKCIRDTHKNQANELETTQVELDAIKDAAKGLYEVTSGSIKDCSNEDCIKKLMQKVELRGKSLISVMKSYREKVSDVRKQFIEGQQSCLNTGNFQYQNSLTAAKNGLKGCVR